MRQVGKVPKERSSPTGGASNKGPQLRETGRRPGAAVIRLGLKRRMNAACCSYVLHNNLLHHSRDFLRGLFTPHVF
jgi:hypothetical protein